MYEQVQHPLLPQATHSQLAAIKKGEIPESYEAVVRAVSSWRIMKPVLKIT